MFLEERQEARFIFTDIHFGEAVLDNKSLQRAKTPSDQPMEEERKQRPRQERRKREKRTGGKKKKRTQGNKKESQFCSMRGGTKASQWFCLLYNLSPATPTLQPCHQHWGNELRKHGLLRNCVFIFLRNFKFCQLSRLHRWSSCIQRNPTRNST